MQILLRVITEGLVNALFLAADFEFGWVPADTVLCSAVCSKTEEAV
jgi:hypothetical protein